MSRRWKAAVIGVGGVVLVAAVVWLQSENWFQPRTNQAEVRAKIEAALPLGSTVEQTLAFLDEQGWLPPGAVPTPNEDYPEDEYMQQDPSGSTSFAAVEDAYPGLIIYGGIYMKFGFDANGLLTRYEIEDSWTGP